PPSLLPPGFDDVAARVVHLHADVVRLVPLADEFEAVGPKTVGARAYIFGRCRGETKVKKLRQRRSGIPATERERERIRVAHHQRSVLGTTDSLEIEVRLVEPARSNLVPHSKCEMAEFHRSAAHRGEAIVNQPGRLAMSSADFSPRTEGCAPRLDRGEQLPP